MAGFLHLVVGASFVIARSGASYAPSAGCEEELNAWCTENCPLASTFGPLYARLDGASRSSTPMWRCYTKHSLSPDLQRYVSGVDYCTRDPHLKSALERCIEAREQRTTRSIPASPSTAARQPPPTQSQSKEGAAASTEADGQCSQPEAGAELGLDPAKRYLAFSVNEREQLNKQRRALFFYMRLARSLNRVLLLPRVSMVRKNPQAWMGKGLGSGSWIDLSATEFLSLSEVYNVSLLSKFVEVAELADVWSLASHTVPDSTPMPEAEGDRVIDVLFHSMGRTPCEPESNVVTTFNGVPGVLVKSSACSSPKTSSAAGVVPHAHAQVIAYADVFDQVPEMQAKPLAPYLRFVDTIYDEARSFVDEAFGGEPFIAVHWRRADFKLTRAARDDVLLDSRKLVERIKHAMQERGVRHVYIATDATEEADLELLRRELGYRSYDSIPNPNEPNLVKAMRVANIEIAICALSVYFLGTRTSNFSATIREERAIQGSPAASNDFLI